LNEPQGLVVTPLNPSKIALNPMNGFSQLQQLSGSLKSKEEPINPAPYLLA